MIAYAYECSYLSVSNCANTAQVTSTAGNCGGITGVLRIGATTDCLIEYCYNKGNIQGYLAGAGVVGNVTGTGGQCTITLCYNKGEIGASYMGSIIGYQNSSIVNYITLNNLYYLSSLNLGAIAGADDDANNVKAVDDDLDTYDEFIAWIEQQ